MSGRHVKIIIDICMTIFLILSFVRWSGTNGAFFHFTVGSLCALFFAAHIFVHRKWIKAITKSCLAGKLNKSLKWKYIINMLLLFVWAISILTGFIALAPFFDAASGVYVIGRVHGITARIGLGLIVIHIAQHLPQIKSYFGIKK